MPGAHDDDPSRTITATANPAIAPRPDRKARRRVGLDAAGDIRPPHRPVQIRFSAPIPRRPAAVASARSRCRVDLYHPLPRFRIGMIAQNFHARMTGAGDAVQHRAERARIAAGAGHQLHAIDGPRPFPPRANRRSAASTRAPITTAPPPTKSPSSMPNRNDRPAACRIERVPSRCATWPISWAMTPASSSGVSDLIDQAPRTRRCARPAARSHWLRCAAPPWHASGNRQAPPPLPACPCSLPKAARPATSLSRLPHSNAGPRLRLSSSRAPACRPPHRACARAR